MKIKLMDSNVWIDTKSIIAFSETNEDFSYISEHLQDLIMYLVYIPGATFKVSKADYYALHDIWRNER